MAMNGRTRSYLDLSVLPAVGGLVLDPRPAFVFRGDGSALLWANAAAVAFFGAPDMAGLLDRRFARGGTLAAQVARLAKALPADHDRLEVLRFSLGVTQSVLSAACRRLDLGGGARAVLVVGAVPGPRESLTTRAETLADVLAGDDSLAAVLGPDGRVLGASGGFDALEPAGPALDALILDAERAADPVLRRSVAAGSLARDAGIARIAAGAERLFLLVVGPGHPVAASAPAPEPPAPAPEPPPRPAAPAPAPRSETRTVRFLWRTDADGTFTFVSPEFAGAVGRDNVPAADERWTALAARVPVGGADALADALARLASFTDVTVRWPVAGTGEAVAVAVSGVPEFARDRTFRGFRGFGLVRLDDRRPAPVAAAAPAAPPPSEALAAPAREARAAPADDLDDVARELIEGAPHHDAPAAPAPVAAPPAETPPASSNIVRMPAAPTRILPPRPLSGHEEDAFRRIAEALGARMAEPAPPEIVPPLPPVPPRPAAPDTTILDRLPVGVVVYRGEVTLHANRALVEMLGHADRNAFVAAGGIAAMFPAEGGVEGPRGGRLEVRRADGTDLAVEARLHVVPWPEAPAMMLTLLAAAEAPVEDAAPEAGLAGRVRELETILDTATDGVVLIEGDGRISGLNHTAEALFGVESGDVAGAPFTDLLAEESRRSAIDYIDGLSANGVASVLNDGREVIGKASRGGLIPLFMTIGRLGESGKYCAVLRDITHWKNVEVELVAARRAAEAANAQKSEFLAKISHEIRTPLNAIIGFSEVMMEERFGPIGSDRYRSYLRDIHVSGEHLMSLINDLLDLSKVEAGKLDLDFEAVSLNEVIRDVVALMQPQANRERIIIRTSLSTSLPSVVADVRSLRQILLNLLSNAIKFTRSGGQVIVATALEENGEVVIRIRDTGIGMNPGDIDIAMKPFRQVATSGRAREGTGLGLPLTKALVEANRASFAIDSVPDQGTLVRVTFPTTRVLAG